MPDRPQRYYREPKKRSVIGSAIGSGLSGGIGSAILTGVGNIRSIRKPGY